MSSFGKNKGKNMGAGKRVDEFMEKVKEFTKEVTEKVNSFTTAVNEKLGAFAKEWLEKTGQLENMVKVSVIRSAQEFGKVWANQEAMGSSFDVHDTYILTLHKLSLEIFGQLQHVDALFKRLQEQHEKAATDGTLVQFSLDFTEAEIEELRTEAKKWYTGAVASCLKTVQSEKIEAQKLREEAQKKQAEAEAAAKAAAEKIDADTKEKERCEAELKAAETAAREVVSEAVGGGKGSDIPPEAEVFGG